MAEGKGEISPDSIAGITISANEAASQEAKRGLSPKTREAVLANEDYSRRAKRNRFGQPAGYKERVEKLEQQNRPRNT